MMAFSSMVCFKGTRTIECYFSPSSAWELLKSVRHDTATLGPLPRSRLHPAPINRGADSPREAENYKD